MVIRARGKTNDIRLWSLLADDHRMAREFVDAQVSSVGFAVAQRTTCVRGTA